MVPPAAGARQSRTAERPGIIRVKTLDQTANSSSEISSIRQKQRRLPERSPLRMTVWGPRAQLGTSQRRSEPNGGISSGAMRVFLKANASRRGSTRLRCSVVLASDSGEPEAQLLARVLAESEHQAAPATRQLPVSGRSPRSHWECEPPRPSVTPRPPDRARSPAPGSGEGYHSPP
jgi:hypothetical protein